MDNTSNATAWVVGAIIVILALVGIWWVATGGNNAGIPNTGTPNTDINPGTDTGTGTY